MTSAENTPLSKAIPVLAAVDALVLGGTIEACVNAWQSALSGKRTILASPENSLPFEFCVCRRAWVRDAELTRLPRTFQSAFAQSESRKIEGGDRLLNLAKLAIAFEDILLDAGVTVFYGMHACRQGIDLSSDWRGMVFGGKFGLAAVRTETVTDHLPNAMPSGSVRERPARVPLTLTAKVGVVDGQCPIIGARAQRNTCPTKYPEESFLLVPGIPELPTATVNLHGPYAAFALSLPLNPESRLPCQDLSCQARLVLAKIGKAIQEDRRTSGKPPLYFHRFSGSVASSAAGRLPPPPSHATLPKTLSLRFGDSARLLHWSGETVAVARSQLPILAECDVLVAGGGTSGVPAALTAAQAGVSTILVEGQADVGGVRTVGGVPSYWFGRDTPWLLACDERYDQLSESSGMAEEISMLQCLREEGVQVLVESPIVGVILDAKTLVGVIVLIGGQLGAILGKVTVDATGDGDIAAWAGADYEYGNGRDAMTLWASFANFNEEKRTASRQYESSMETRDPYDYARTAVRGRRAQGVWKHTPHEMPQHYPTARESRRIAGLATITYGGILAGITYPDVMTVCEANFDIKGIASSDLLNCGVFTGWNPRKLYKAAVPYRAVLPVGLEGLLVAGRAYSASHDAISLARMQKDMTNLGASVGIAAAMAAASGVAPTRLDICKLQKAWVAKGTLRKTDLAKFGQNQEKYTKANAERDLKDILGGKRHRPPRLARLMSAKTGIPLLRRGFGAAKDGLVKVMLGRALCFHGDGTAVPYLMSKIRKQTAKGLPPPRRRCLRVPPEHGCAPEPVYSLFALSLALSPSGNAAETQELAGVLTRICEHIPDSSVPFGTRQESPFEYVKAVCAVAERLPGPEMVPPLEALLQRNCLSGNTIPFDQDPRLAQDTILERLGYLEICVGRALARCADLRGFEILLRYLDDLRGCLARSSEMELADILNLDISDFTGNMIDRVQQQVANNAYAPFRQRLG